MLWHATLVVVLLFFFSLPVLVQAKENSRPGKIRVAYSVEAIPFHFQNAAGEPDGMVIDKWRLWSEKTGITVEFVPAPWDKTIEMVRNQEADVHAGLFFTEARDVYLDYGPPLVRSDTHIFYDTKLPPPRNYKDFKAYRVGLIKGDAVDSWIKHHLPELSTVPYSSYDELMAALKRGDIKVFAADTLTALNYLYKAELRQEFHFNSNTPLYTKDFFVAVKQGNTDLLKTIFSGMALITKEEDQAISRQWASGAKETAKDSLIIAMDRAYPPLTLMGPDGQPRGLLVDMWRLWSEATGLKIQFRPSSWTESLAAVKNGEADIHSGLFKTDDRAEWMAFSIPIHRAETTLYFHGSDSPVPLDTLKGETVGVLSGSFQETYLQTHFPEIKPLYCTDGEQLILALLRKNARAILHETMAVEAELSRMGLSGTLNQFPEIILSNAIYAGIPKFRDDMLPLINEGFSAIPYSELANLELRWIPRKENRFYLKDTDSIFLTQEEKQFVAGHKPLSFSEVNWKPLSIIDQSGGFDGIIADYMNLITQRSGLRFEFRKSSTWSQVLQQYTDGTLDVVPALGKDDEIGRKILLSDPFVTFPLVIVTRDNVSYIGDTDQLKGLKVGVGRGYTSSHFLKKAYPDINLVEADDVEAGLILLSNREIEAFVGHMAVVIHTIQEKGLTNLKIAGETPFRFDHRIGVDPRYPEAVSIINKVLATLAEQDHQTIYKKWLSVHYETGIDYSLIFKIVAGGILFLMMMFYWNRKLSREVLERKRTESRLLETERKTRAMSEAIHDGLIMIDEKARVMYWNHAAENLFGITSEEAMGKDMHTLFVPEEHLAAAQKGLETFARTGEGPVLGKLLELTAQRRDGTQFPVEVGVSGFQMGDRWYAVGTIRDITERNRVQEIIRKTRTELQQIFDSAQVGILFLKENRSIHRCNTRTAEILGYESPKELINMSMADIHLNRNNFEAFGREYYGLLTRGEQVRTEYQLKKKDGSGIWCSLSGKAVDTETPPDLAKGLIWVVDDISEKRRARQELKESEARVKTILDSISTGIILIDPENRIIVDVNPVAARMIGLPRNQILGHCCHEFICPSHDHDCPIIDHLQPVDNAERILLTAARQEIPVLKTVVPVILGGKKHLLESLVDITDRKEAEKEVKKNLEELEKFYKLTINREEKMIELKDEINQLLVKMGSGKKYKIR